MLSAANFVVRNTFLLLAALFAALCFSSPALAQSAGCNLINSGSGSRTIDGNQSVTGGQTMLAGERVILEYERTAGISHTSLQLRALRDGAVNNPDSVIVSDSIANPGESERLEILIPPAPPTAQLFNWRAQGAPMPFNPGTATITLTCIPNGTLTPGALTIAPSSGLAASGPEGGPFSPSSASWTLQNTGGSSIDVMVAATGTFFDVTGAPVGTPFALAAGATRTVTTTLNAAAEALPEGVVSGSVTFTNATNGVGNSSRAVQLTVEQNATSLFLTSSANPSLVGSTVRFTARAVPASASGQVVFTVDGVVQTPVPLQAGVAVLDITPPSTGSYEVGARYSGDAAHDPSTALPFVQTVVASNSATLGLIQDTLSDRASLVLSHFPMVGRGVIRLNGVNGAASGPGPAVLSYLSIVAKGDPLPVSASLGAIDALAGNEQQRDLDIWFDATFAHFDNGGRNGRFAIGTLGVDYIVNPDLLIGAFAQFDVIDQVNSLSPQTASGTGWIAGPYLTWRLTDQLFFDIAAGVGTSSNTVTPFGTYQDTFDTTRWLVSAGLEGQFDYGNWTFVPRARISYFEDTSAAYVDGLGFSIPSLTQGVGRISVGPGVGYRHLTNDGIVVNTGVRVDGVGEFGTGGTGGFSARAEATVDLQLPEGVGLGASISQSGIGAPQSATGLSFRFSGQF